MAIKTTRDNLPDLQNGKDTRGKRIERVGIDDVKMPLRIRRKDEHAAGVDEVVEANISMYVSVEQDIKGINMSRLLETLMSYQQTTLTSATLRGIITDMIMRLESNDGYIRIAFNYFVPRKAPVSGKIALQAYECAFIGKLVDKEYRFIIEVNAIGTNLCPCSKEISAYGAHNQRNHVRARIVPTDTLVWLEDIIELVENEFSCPIFPLLKREDEKWVTETAYENPKFVEDVSRDLALAFDHADIQHYQIRSAADESIHHHQAVSTISKQWILQ